METVRKPRRNWVLRSRRCTKNCGAGGWKTRWLGLWFVISLLCSAPEAHAFTERVSWIFEQIASQPQPTAENQPRGQLGASGSNYSDTLSLQATGLVDLKAVEIQAKASQRLF